ncbi:MAG TPA: hypothetical protein VFD33_05325, partial [Bacillota bacterium]|nr:hypothetical protein [Bacillota bacterium]
SDQRLLYYFDYESKTAMPFCAEPNCMHDTEECPAKNNYDAYIIVNNNLYAIESTSDRQLSEDISYTQSNIVSTDIGGTNKRILATFDGSVSGKPPRDSNIYYYKDCIYFVAEALEIKDSINTNYSKWNAYCYNIKRKSLKKLGELCSGYHCFVIVQGMTEDRLYFNYHFSEKDLDYISYDNEDDYFSDLESLLQIDNLYLDLETHEIHKNNLPNIDDQSRVFAGYYFYSNNRGHFIARNLMDNTEVKILDKPSSHYYWMGDRLIFYVDKNPNDSESKIESDIEKYYWLPKTNTIHEIPLRKDQIVFKPFIKKGKYCYGISIYPEYSGKVCLSYTKVANLTKENLKIIKVR